MASGEEAETGPGRDRNLGWEAVTSRLFTGAIKETLPVATALQGDSGGLWRPRSLALGC